MDDGIANDVLAGQLRTMFATVGGALVTGGVLSGNTVNIILSVLVAIVPFVLSAWSKHRAEKKTQVREFVAVKAGVAAGAIGAEIPATVTPSSVPDIIKTYAPLAAASAPAEVRPAQGSSP